MSKVLRHDRGNIKGSASRTDEGYIHADAIVTRTGVFVYQNPDGTVRRELRHPDDVFKRDSLDTMKMIPITNGHPEARLVNADNAKDLTIGHVGENIVVDGQYVMAPMRVTHKDGVDSVDMGRKELSLGYTVELEKVDGEYNGERYDHRQRNIQYNHLAIVDRARAGGAARINMDSGDAIQTTDEGKKPMKKVTLDGIEYDAAPEVVNALSKAAARADAAEKSVTEITKQLETLKADADKTKAELDAMKEKAEDEDEEKKAKKDGELRAAVKARLDLERVAEKVITGDAREALKLDEMNDADLMKAVIMAAAPKAKLDGQSDAYIKARFDAIAEDAEEMKSIGDQRKTMGERKDGKSTATDAEKARIDSFEALRSMYKTKQGE